MYVYCKGLIKKRYLNVLCIESQAKKIIDSFTSRKNVIEIIRRLVTFEILRIVVMQWNRMKLLIEA